MFFFRVILLAPQFPQAFDLFPFCFVGVMLSAQQLQIVESVCSTVCDVDNMVHLLAWVITAWVLAVTSGSGDDLHPEVFPVGWIFSWGVVPWHPVTSLVSEVAGCEQIVGFFGTPILWSVGVQVFRLHCAIRS